ncbi:MAG: hypothetical protein Crog4KO_17000 [Crocinitomicaceae bacterium]
MKKKFIYIFLTLSIGFGTGGYFISEDYDYFQSFAINLSTTFLAISLGVIVVNIYLDKDGKKGAVRSIFHLSNDSMTEFHNKLLDLMWSKFGKNEFIEILDEYVEGGGDPDIISPEKREKIFTAIKTNHGEILNLITTLDQTLAEMISLIGWDLDPYILEKSLDARRSIIDFREIKLSAENENDPAIKKAIIEHALDIDLFTSMARRKIIELGEIDDE